ncbi:nuclear transport factor 2 family protein [Kaistia defluvii]|uniref:nuclear transport factor 2 family protein n=1 Tax=Kaistia defluvii TaxID=410841 RepID=UPI002254874A|nr:nuclear transport factor 2 family protein [Kaistia defluvii]MCX5519891.1 nuclear transport factor 2 family protein [Kaistia defluvii]
MTNPAALVERYIASWNETDPAKRRELIAATFTESASYGDPMMKSDGHGGIDCMMAAAQERFAGLRFKQVGRIDAYEDRVRFSWELGPDGGPSVAGGTDFATVNTGRLAHVVGFLDFAPAA